MCALSALGFLPREFFESGFVFFRRFRVLVFGGGPECGEGTAAGKVAKSGYPERAEFFEGLVDGGTAEVAVEEVADLFSGEAVVCRLKSLEDAIGDGVCDRGTEEGAGRMGTVVPEGEGGLKVGQLDDGAAVESGVEGAQAQYLSFGPTGGGGVESGTGPTQDGVVVVPKFCGGRVAGKAELALALYPLDGQAETAGDGGLLFGVDVAAIGETLAALHASPEAAVGEAVVGFGAAKGLGELALGDVTDEAEMCSAGGAIPGAAQQGGERGAAAAHGVEHGGKFLGECEQTRVACLVAHDGKESSGGETGAGHTILRPGGIDFGEELGYLVPTGSLAGLAGFPDEDDEEVEGVAGGADHAVRGGADQVAKAASNCRRRASG